MKHRIAIITAAVLLLAGAGAVAVANATTKSGGQGVSVACTRSAAGQVTMSETTSSAVSDFGSFVLTQNGADVYNNWNVDMGPGSTASNTVDVTPSTTTFVAGYIITASGPNVGHGYTLSVNCSLVKG